MGTVETRFTTSGVQETQAACGNVSKGFSSVSDSAGKMASSLDFIKTSFYALGGAWAASKLVEGFKYGIQVVDDFVMSVSKVAAMVTSLGGYNTGTLAKDYAEAEKYAEGIYVALQKVDSNTSLNIGNLQTISEEMIKQGVYLDTNSKSQIESFTRLANAVAVYSNNGKMDHQVRQETAALMRGEVNIQSQLSSMLQRTVDGPLDQWVQKHKQSGDLLEAIGDKLKGFGPAADRIAGTWSAVSSSMKTSIDVILKSGFDLIFKDVVSYVDKANDGLRAHKEEITLGIHKGWLAVKDIASSLLKIYGTNKSTIDGLAVGVGMVFKGWGLIAAILPPIAERIGAMFSMVIDMGKSLASAAGAAGLFLTGNFSAAKALLADSGASFKSAGQSAGKMFATGLGDEIALRANKSLALDKLAQSQTTTGASPKANNQETPEQIKERQRLAEAARIEYNAYVTLFNGMISKVEEANPALTQHDKTLMKINNEIDKAIADHPLHKKSFEEARRYIIQTTEAYQAQADIMAAESNKTDSAEQWSKGFDAAGQSVEKFFSEYNQAQALALEMELSGINAAEKFYQISSGDAATKRIDVLSRSVILLQQQHDLLNDTTDPAGLARLQILSKIRSENEKLLDQQKLLYDATAIGGMTNAINKYGDDATNVGKQVESSLTNVFRSLEDSITNVFAKGEVSAKAMFDLIRAEAARALIAKPLTNSFAQMFNPGSPTKFNADGSIAAAGVSQGALAPYALPIGAAIVGGVTLISTLTGMSERSRAAAENVRRFTQAIAEFSRSLEERVLRLKGDETGADLKAFQNKQLAERDAAEKMYKDALKAAMTFSNSNMVDDINRIAASMQTGMATLAEVQAGEMEKFLQGQTDAVAKAAKESATALTTELSTALGKTVDIAISAASAMRDIQSGSLSTDSPAERLRKAKEAWDMRSPEKAGELGKTYLTALQGMYASGAEYQSGYLDVMSSLQALSKTPVGTTAERQLTVLESIRDLLRDNKYDAANAAYNSLPAYALGGITSGPSIAGEGMYREAIIPLPDGRTVNARVNGMADNKGVEDRLDKAIRALESLDKRMATLEDSARLDRNRPAKAA